MRRLVEALNTCWAPHLAARAAVAPAAGTAGGTPAPGGAQADDPLPITLADFKRDIRERQVWCSSCMIATEGAELIGVLVGAKRPGETLVDRIAVRPDRMRLGHGRHMLDSLGAKLAILGPPRLVAEIPDDQPGAAAFFAACGFAPVERLSDRVLDDPDALLAAGGPGAGVEDATLLIPVTVADLAANGLLADPPGTAWDRAAATLLARAESLQGIGLATVDRIDAFVLYRPPAGGGPGAIIDALGPAPAAAGDRDGADDGRRRAFRRLLGLVLDRTGPPLRLRRVAEVEIPEAWTRSWGFRAAASWRRFTATARPG